MLLKKKIAYWRNEKREVKKNSPGCGREEEGGEGEEKEKEEKEEKEEERKWEGRGKWRK